MYTVKSAGFKKKNQVSYVITIGINCRFSLNQQCNGVIYEPAGLFSLAIEAPFNL